MQTYSAVIHQGRLFVGTWPQGEVYRFESGEAWARVGGGPVGYEREIMGMALYNGKVYLGALPMANVWRMDGEGFAFIGNLDATPVPLRRVWTMAVYQGRLFAGTLPSGRVWSIQAGRAATWDEAFPGGWRHVAAVRAAGQLRLYVDGASVAVSAPFAADAYDLTTAGPLLIGFGPHDYFRGALSDLRVYGRALGAEEVVALASRGGTPG
ncbi:MAG: LamG domain-containing protein [Armatimonadetes bacterium]|nr:LamG domain-containing protein [Armatimonadota bacterium]